MKIPIIYEDQYIIVIDKPSGIPTHKLKEDEKNTLVNFLIEYYPEIIDVGKNPLEAGLLHRLDTNTSGLVIVAKNNESYNNIRLQFKEHKILKEYITLVHGKYNESKVISNFIGRDPKSKKKVRVFSKEIKGTRSAITEIISKRYSKDYTLLKLVIKTGVRHQIRVHLANLEHPIVGDLVYQNTKTKQKDQLELDKHLLHARKLGFYHPKTGKWLELETDLPKDFTDIVKRLGIKFI